MLRVWLPPTTTQQAFRESIRLSLKAADMTTSDSFIVFSQARNWLWENPDGSLVVADPERLRDGPPSPAALRALELDPMVFADYVTANLIRPMPRNAGIKFFMVLPAPSHLPDSALDNLYKEIGRALDDLDMVEYSLYIGQGFGSGAAVVMGRIAFERFYDIGDKLAGEILRRFTDSVGVRTYTFPTSSDGFLCYAESVPGVDGPGIAPDPRRDIGALADEGETQWVEIKGSAFVALDPLLKNGERLDSQEHRAARAFQRAAVGLLNAGGGTVILGAAEAERYPDDAVREHFGDVPRRGRYPCLGLDDEIKGNRDRFELRLRDSLASHVYLAPTGRVEVEFTEYEGRTLVLLRIRRSTEDWYYLDGKEFVVRDGNKADPLDGRARDRYRETNPRGRETH